VADERPWDLQLVSRWIKDETDNEGRHEARDEHVRPHEALLDVPTLEDLVHRSADDEE
jgi:hypothetical protein